MQSVVRRAPAFGDFSRSRIFSTFERWQVLVRRAILAYAVLSGLAGVWAHGAAQENWRLGGEGGVSWTEVTDFSLMMDDSTQAGALQPFELKPDENLLPRLGPWQRWRFPVDPQFRPGHPRLWTDINHNSISRY